MQLPNMSPDRILTCNVDADIVKRLQERGFINAANVCCCLYIYRMAPTIRQLGGIVAAFIDVWNTYLRGAAEPLRLLFVLFSCFLFWFFFCL